MWVRVGWHASGYRALLEWVSSTHLHYPQCNTCHNTQYKIHRAQDSQNLIKTKWKPDVKSYYSEASILGASFPPVCSTHLTGVAGVAPVPPAVLITVSCKGRGSAQQDVQDDPQTPEVTAFIVDTGVMVEGLHHLGGHELCRTALNTRNNHHGAQSGLQNAASLYTETKVYGHLNMSLLWWANRLAVNAQDRTLVIVGSSPTWCK